MIAPKSRRPSAPPPAARAATVEVGRLSFCEPSEGEVSSEESFAGVCDACDEVCTGPREAVRDVDICVTGVIVGAVVVVAREEAVVEVLNVCSLYIVNDGSQVFFLNSFNRRTDNTGMTTH